MRTEIKLYTARVVMWGGAVEIIEDLTTLDISKIRSQLESSGATHIRFGNSRVFLARDLIVSIKTYEKYKTS